MTRRLVWACIAAVLFATPAAATDTDSAMTPVVKGFYTAYLALDQGGIPDAKARAKLEPFITPALDRLLVKGAKAETDYAAMTHDQAPPLLEGDIFTSLFEGASAFHVGACTAKAGKAECEVSLSHPGTDAKEAPANWTDTAVLVETKSGWRIDDIDFGGNWPFANKGTLTGNLAFAIDNANGGSN